MKIRAYYHLPAHEDMCDVQPSLCGISDRRLRFGDKETPADCPECLNLRQE